MVDGGHEPSVETVLCILLHIHIKQSSVAYTRTRLNSCWRESDNPAWNFHATFTAGHTSINLNIPKAMTAAHHYIYTNIEDYICSIDLYSYLHATAIHVSLLLLCISFACLYLFSILYLLIVF